AAGAGSPAVVALFGRELVEDAEMRLAAGAPRAEIDALIEATGLAFQIATSQTSWIAECSEPAVDPHAPRRAVGMPQALAHGLVADALEQAAPLKRVLPPAPSRVAAPASMQAPKPHKKFEMEEKTRVTKCIEPTRPTPQSEGCVVVVLATREPAMLGQRF